MGWIEFWLQLGGEENQEGGEAKAKEGQG